MLKIDVIDLGGPTPCNVYSVNGIESVEERVVLPCYFSQFNHRLSRIGYKEVKVVDTRSDYERWQDEYYHAYYPTASVVEVEVPVSPCVKTIFISRTIEKISKKAFQNLKGVTFEIDPDNACFQIVDNKIVEKDTGKVIWPCAD